MPNQQRAVGKPAEVAAASAPYAEVTPHLIKHGGAIYIQCAEYDKDSNREELDCEPRQAAVETPPRPDDGGEGGDPGQDGEKEPSRPLHAEVGNGAEPRREPPPHLIGVPTSLAERQAGLVGFESGTTACLSLASMRDCPLPPETSRGHM